MLLLNVLFIFYALIYVNSAFRALTLMSSVGNSGMHRAC